MIVVSNASPLISFARINLFRVLHELFGEIHIPQQVHTEVVIQGAGQAGSSETRKADWIRVRTIANTALLAQWHASYNLGLGEIATIILATELGATLALIDERKARVLANSQGVNVIGSIAVLEIAYRRKYISDLRKSYEELQRSGIRIDKRILNQSLASFGLPTL